VLLFIYFPPFLGSYNVFVIVPTLNFLLRLFLIISDVFLVLLEVFILGVIIEFGLNLLLWLWLNLLIDFLCCQLGLSESFHYVVDCQIL